MNNFFIILAAGNGTRFKKKQKKQYSIYKNLKIFEHSVFKAIKSKLFKKIVLVIDNPKNVKNLYSKDLIIIKGGKRRSESSIIALKHIKKFKPKNVLIHDAARPDFSLNLLKKIIQRLKKNNAVIPITKPTDSIKYSLKNNLYNLDREKTYLTQTPQGFNFNELYKLAIIEELDLFLPPFKMIKSLEYKFLTFLGLSITRTIFLNNFDLIALKTECSNNLRFL